MSLETTTDFGIEPAWERRKEVGFFRSIVLTIRGGLFTPSETFSRFCWDGGYWNPILLCLLGSGVSGFGVVFFYGFHLLIGINFMVFMASSVGLLLGLFLGLGAVVASLFLFSGAVMGILSALGVGSLSYQSVFRVVAYTSVLIDILTSICGFALCSFMPKPLSDPMQSAVWILLAIWQGYCIAVGLSKTTSTPFWKPMLAVMLTMILAYGAIEITSISDPIGHRIWDGLYHGVTGSHISS